MESNYILIKEELSALAFPEKALHAQRFFKTGPGQYGEGDIFWGLSNPQIRQVVKMTSLLPLAEVAKLIIDPVHECRLMAVLFLVKKMKKAIRVNDEQEKTAIYQFYQKYFNTINNWDLVDLSAPDIVGAYLYTTQENRGILALWANSSHLWTQRIAMVSTLYLVRQGEYEEALRIAAQLIYHPHDLIHKAVGWVLREVGKKSGLLTLDAFLAQYATQLPRTALRYAIERHPVFARKQWLAVKKEKSLMAMGD